MTPRILFHVQHLLGIGHTRRAALLVQALQAEGLAVTVLSGGEPLATDWGGAELVQLPWARALDADFKTLVDEQGRPLDDAFHIQRALLVEAAWQRLRPALLVLESYPFGRRAFRQESNALIAAARRSRAPVVTSLRDIVVTRAIPDWAAQVVERVKRDIDWVLVHGDPALVPLEASFAPAGEISDRLRYTGYVAPLVPSGPPEAESGEILISVGGGAVGGALLEAAIAAHPFTALRQRPWRLLAGPNLPQAHYEGLARRLPTGVVLQRFRSDFPSLLRRCHLSLSQAGYNTMLDLLQAGARALVVPFAAGGETEQALRARLLAERGVVGVYPEARLAEPERLAEALDRAAAVPRPRVPPLALDGARRSARLIAAFAQGAVGD